MTRIAQPTERNLPDVAEAPRQPLPQTQAMSWNAAFLDQRQPPSVLVAATEEPLAQDLYRVEGDHGTLVRWCDGSRMRTAGDVFTEMAEVLDLPPTMTYDWDALEECLGDRYTWLRRPSAILVVKHAESVLSDDDQEFRALLDVLTRAAAWVAEPPDSRPDSGTGPAGVALHCVLLAATTDVDGLRSRIERTGLPGAAFARLTSQPVRSSSEIGVAVPA